MSRLKIIDKIQKLLALSTSSNEHEAALALSRAHDLMSAHNLRLSQVEIQENPILQRPIAFSDGRNGSHEKAPTWLTQIIHETCKSFNCFSYTNKNNITFLVGTFTDTQVAEYVSQYLIRSVNSIVDKHISSLRSDKLKWKSIKSKSMYELNYTNGIVHSIILSLQSYVKDHHPKGEGLIHLKSAKLDEYKTDLMDRLGLSYQRKNITSGQGFASGQADGKSISINPALRAKAKGTKLLK